MPQSITKCTGYDPDDKTKCALCAANHVVVTNDSTATGASCASISGDPLTNDPLLASCNAVINTFEYKCTSCKPGNWAYYQSSGYLTCFDIWDLSSFNCARFNWNTKDCDICEDGFEYDAKHGPVACIAIASPEDWTCTQEVKNGVCLKCHGTNYRPFHWKPAAPVNGNDYIYRCIDQGRAMDDEFFYFPRGFDLSTNTYFTLTTYVPYSNFFGTPSGFGDSQVL